MDLSRLKWPLIIVALAGIGWLGTSGGVGWMYDTYTEATPGVDPKRDQRDEAGLSRIGGYTFHLWQWEKAIDILETAIERYGEVGANYWFNLERLSTCYDRIGEYQVSYDLLQVLIRARAHELDERVSHNDNLKLRAEKLKEMYDLR